MPDLRGGAPWPPPQGPRDPWAVPPGAFAAPRPARGLPVALVLTLALVVALLSGGAGGSIGWFAARAADGGISTGAPLPVSGSGPARPADSVAGVAERLLPSVVSISVRGDQGAGTGSGFVIRQDGYVLTNNHVVALAADGGRLRVQFNDGSSVAGTIVGRDPSYDLAVVKVDRDGLPQVALGDSDAVSVGDPVVAIGSPLGLAGTVTSGIVSAKDRPVTAGGEGGSEESFIDAIQTDAAINPGNSGGPLVDATGKVIGVNSAIASLSSGTGQSGSIGLGFAIPINQAKRTAEQLIKTGKATYPVIGARVDTSYQGQGAKIVERSAQVPDPLTPGGPADDAGLRPGDVVTAVDGKAVNDSSELIVAIRARQPGAVVALTVQRGGRTFEVKVTLGESSGG
ncbi:MAG TPA: trypsin-like peptidase domain-containing protein [Motilibacteraceae bacterium]|nr:trypsin-like peptidase domain-containing protein [Motilibacteraceae bacterium]